MIDVYSLAVDIAENYRLNSLEVLSLLKKHFREGVVTLSIAEKIKEQVEEQISEYEVREEVVEQALALLKLEGFKKDKNGNFYTEIRVNKTRLEELLLYWKEAGEPAFGFHYDPYNFDSKPEKEFFESLLHLLNEDPDEVEDIYFTGQ